MSEPQENKEKRGEIASQTLQAVEDYLEAAQKANPKADYSKIAQKLNDHVKPHLKEGEMSRKEAQKMYLGFDMIAKVPGVKIKTTADKAVMEQIKQAVAVTKTLGDYSQSPENAIKQAGVGLQQMKEAAGQLQIVENTKAPTIPPKPEVEKQSAPSQDRSSTWKKAIVSAEAKIPKKLMPQIGSIRKSLEKAGVIGKIQAGMHRLTGKGAGQAKGPANKPKSMGR